MGNIIVLDENTSNKIAAGEVIERPASVVKELLENAIDAGADNISIEIKNGGVSFIKIVDNGSGMAEDDVQIAFERHATSKIRGAKDLAAISTMGFRGEALASIAAVSIVQVSTRTSESNHGGYIEIRGGTVTDVRQKGCPKGTTFIVRDLFFNTPVRYKFLKKDTTEAGYVSDMVSRIALGNPHISIKLISNGKTVLHTPGNNDLKSTIFSIYGKEISGNLCNVEYKDNIVSITGYVGKAEISRSNRNQQSFYINRRYIKSKTISAAIDGAYKTVLMKNKYAFAVLNIEINPLLIDVNVHPSKIEVKFSNEQELFRSVYHAVNNALIKVMEFKKIDIANNIDESNSIDKSIFIREKRKSDVSYEQQAIAASFPNHSVKEQVEAAESLGRLEAKQDLRSEVLGMPEMKQAQDIEALGMPEMKQAQDIEVLGMPETNQAQGIEGLRRLETEHAHEIGGFGKPETKQDLGSEVLGMPEMKQAQATEVICVAAKDIVDKKENSSDLFSDTVIVGQAFSTYIILQKAEELILIDQHAAHERIIFEKLKKEYYNNKPLTQMLVAPLILELTYQEAKFSEENKDFFAKLGFNFDDFGNNSVILRSVPLNEKGLAIKDLFLEIMDLAMNSSNNDYKNIEEEALYSVACKAAVKANKRLGEIEIRELIKELETLGNPYTCPHGRPSVIRLSKQQLEKMFRRVL